MAEKAKNKNPLVGSQAKATTLDKSFDGNKFAASALDKGCAYAIVDEKEYANLSDGRYILVNDCLSTFKALARHHRRQFHIPVIGITGTNGKTTTKELVSAVLSEKYNVLFTHGNIPAAAQH